MEYFRLFVATLAVFVLLSAHGHGALPGLVTIDPVPGHPFLSARQGNWVVDTISPIVSIGAQGMGPAYDMDGIQAVIRTLSGGFAVALSSEAGTSIRLFDAAGRYKRTLGRRGQGPGEMITISSLAVLPGDSLFVYDRMQRRITIFDSSGGTVRTHRVQAAGIGLSDLYPLAGGGLVGAYRRAGVRSQARPHVVRDSTVIVSLDTIAGTYARITVIPDREGVALNNSVTLVHTYTPSAAWTVSGDRMWAGASDSVVVRVFDPTGRIVRTVRAPTLDVELERDSIAAERERWAVEARTSGPVGEHARARLAVASFPRLRPRYDGILVDGLGNMWLKERAKQARIVVSPAGTVIGLVNIPPHRRLWAVGGDWVLQSVTDSLGLQKVQLLRLRKS